MATSEFWKYLRPLKRWWWLIVLAGMVAGVSSMAYGLSRPLLYRSTATLMIGSAIQDPNPDNTQFFLAQALARTYADIARRDSVRGAVMQALEMDWLPSYSVTARTDSQLLEVAVVDVDPDRAQAVAAELVNQLFRLSPAGRESNQREFFVQEQLQKLETTILDTEEEIVRRGEELAQALSARDIRDIEDDIRALENKITSLQANYAALLSNTGRGAINTVNVIDPPVVPTQPVSGDLWVTAALAALIGALLGTAAAYLLEFIDDRIKTVENVHDMTDLPTLGTIPAIANVAAKQRGLVMIADQQDISAEAFRVLRTNLLFASVDHPLHVLQIASPSPNEGKSLVASNVATAFAQTGKRVVLVDADLRRPSVHRLFGLVNNVGVTSALVGGLETVESTLQKTTVPNLLVMTSGPLPPNPSELLSSQRMQELLARLKGLCDLVVLDSPPVTLVSDTAVLAGSVDGVLLVFRAVETRRDAARNAVRALQQVHAHLLGVALNFVSGDSHGYFYSYNSDYGNRYYRTAYMRNKGQRSGNEDGVSRQPSGAVSGEVQG
ncbi:MAG: polysaccharide biosynthesis tyrosine autokinase [Caldilineaceae bacterium]|nr:polysaccharide biosynthesis tyrosine autokinase [Caldilineaceae bacterium]